MLFDRLFMWTLSLLTACCLRFIVSVIRFFLKIFTILDICIIWEYFNKYFWCRYYLQKDNIILPHKLSSWFQMKLYLNLLFFSFLSISFKIFRIKDRSTENPSNTLFITYKLFEISTEFSNIVTSRQRRKQNFECPSIFNWHDHSTIFST